MNIRRVVHAKSYVCDDQIGTVGSINRISEVFTCIFECGTMLYQCEAIHDIKTDMEQCFEQCHQVTRGDCRQGVIGGLFTSVLRVLAPLM